MPSVLHVGCGRDPLPEWLADHDEVRLDIDPDVQPHIVASMTDLGDIGPFDAIYTSHALEHLYPQDVPVALAEFQRVLAPGGFVVLFVPDLEDLQPTDDVLYTAACGDVRAKDLFYGYEPLLDAMPHMAHHTGFVAKTLEGALVSAGFDRVSTKRLAFHNLLGAGFKP